ncbi:hypothetical protein BC830DRAFT_1170120 [Chytriomyces sp. MP71]|nr:hypothetical protein BC830DRAFT_1170120 [Chytriomyces sp. MP71]
MGDNEEGELPAEREERAWQPVTVGGVQALRHAESGILFDESAGYAAFDEDRRLWIADGGHVQPQCAAIARVVVTQTQVPRVPVGAIFDVACDASVGRDPRTTAAKAAARHLRLSELAVSRVHARLFLQRVLCPHRGWVTPLFIRDLGSTHGTWILRTDSSECRVAPSKETASSPVELRHGESLRIGSTVLEIHLHAEFPCASCSLSSGAVVLDSSHAKPAVSPPSSASLLHEPAEVSRRREQRALKRCLLGTAAPAAHSVIQADYVDRSAIRRKLHGSSDDLFDNRDGKVAAYSQASTHSSAHEQKAQVQQYLFSRHYGKEDQDVSDGTGNAPKTDDRAGKPSIEASASPLVDGVGQSMLLKLGWQPGTGVGARRDGIQHPVQTVKREGKKGLGL